jgi:periplasmic divalent cation tolerance protein
MLTLLYSPFPTLDSARAACAALLDARVVACCNLLTGAESHYVWQGAPTSTTEIILIAKTTPEMAARARDILATNHPHEVPAILSLSADANPAFAAWVGASVAPTRNTEKGD